MIYDLNSSPPAAPYTSPSNKSYILYHKSEMNISLIGYRATGKTTIVKHLADRLGWQWIDADVEIERRVGKSIAQIFADEGEPAFRDLEAEVVADLAARDRWVLALGGGAVLREDNRRAIADGGTVVWLTASAETIYARMTGDDTTAGRRPNLTASGGLTEIQELLAFREPIYRQSADVQVDTENKTPEEIADEILQAIEH